jgi:hypothetical protein
MPLGDVNGGCGEETRHHTGNGKLFSSTGRRDGKGRGLPTGISEILDFEVVPIFMIISKGSRTTGLSRRRVPLPLHSHR